MKAANSFVFDANRCTGCGACRVACTIENQLAPAVSWRRIETFNPRHHPIAPVFHLSLACNHCQDAACMRACPALAYSRDAATGAVLLSQDACIGCRYCAWACPYDAPVFDEAMGVMTKCTWCVDRLKSGVKPACASLCPTGALDFADVPAGERSQAIEGFPAAPLDPSLHVIPLKPGRVQPEMTAGEVLGPFSGAQDPSDAGRQAFNARISLHHEWPLAAFTLAMAVLVGIVTGAAAGAYAISPWPFVVASGAALALAGSHLGRKARVWRAILNLRHSWLSREVALTSAFVALAVAWVLFAPGSRAIGWTAAIVGLLGLFAADRLYGVLPAGPGDRHSAGVVSTGLLAGAALANLMPLAAGLGAIKLVLYVTRKLAFAREGRPVRPILGAVRASLTLLALGILWTDPPSGARALAFVMVLAGEAIDRAEYYTELERETPRRQMDLALARRVAGQTAYTDGACPSTPNATVSPA